MAETRSPRLGKYELLARIATGGMAEIFLARQPGPGKFSRLVVVKRILPHLAERRQFLEMFLEEARLASLVQHQNVVQIFDVGQSEDSFFIAMEYIDGLGVSTLARRSRKEGIAVPYPVACEIVAQTCDGLHAAHELRDEHHRPLGLVHRDVSPQNLVLSRSGLVKLVDFGIAKARGSDVRTRTGALKGKFPYMSPEQCRGEPLDRRSDVFSLASVLIELVAGERVFERPSELMTLKAITEERVPLAHELNPAVPEVVSRAIARAHQREPADRFSTAAEMGEALRSALSDCGQETSPETLARYLAVDCAELVEARAASLVRLGELAAPSSSVPRLAGFDEVTFASGAEITRPDVVSAPRGRARRAGRARRLAIVSLAGLLLLGGAGLAAWLVLAERRPAGPPLVFACPPYYPPETVREGLEPLASYLERRLGRRVEVSVPADYDSILDEITSGRADFANLSPVLLARLRRRSPEVVVLASHTYEGARSYQSLIIARDDAPVDSVESLRGRTFCYVDRDSTSGFLLPRHFFRSRGLDPDSALGATRMSGTHVDVMRDVVAGRCEAGAIFSGALLSAQGLDVATSRLQIVMTAGQTPWDVLVGAPDLDPQLRDEIRRALLDFDPVRELGRPIVSETFRIDGFVETRLEEFDAVEQAALAEGLLD